MSESIQFPKGFLWGTAACAHQVEGDNVHSDWWAFEQIPGKIRNGDKSGKACDHYNRYEEDFDLCVEMNNNAHRLSIEWARIEPREGVIDEDAIAHYHLVLDALEKRNITPFVTVHHFTLPMWFAMRGGFSESRNLRFFERHVGLLADCFGDRVKYWNTINEPAVHATIGYMAALFPPGIHDFWAYRRVLKNILVAHATAYHILKSANPDSQVALVKNIPIFNPANPASFADRKLAQMNDFFFNEFLLEGIRSGRLRKPVGDGKVFPGVQGSVDFFGLNYYNQVLCSIKAPGDPQIAAPGERATQLGWTPYPIGLRKGIHRLAEFGLPIYITENGIGTDDDAWRCAFLLEHLRQVHESIKEGADVRGYFQWSLLDNFEWADGYNSQFGLVSVDPKTFKRTPKDSFKLFGQVAKQNAVDEKLFEKHPW